MIEINLDKKKEKNKIRALSPTGFEEYMAELFKYYGYDVTITPPTNDGGKDLILKYNERKYYVECKHFNDGAVGREIIQKLVGAGIVDGDVDGFIVATTSYFNDNAIACMEKSKVPLFLLDMDDIVSLYIDNNIDVTKDIFISKVQDAKDKFQRFTLQFGSLKDFTCCAGCVYRINTKTIKEHKFNNVRAVEASYCFSLREGKTSYRRAVFAYYDTYYVLSKAIINEYTSEIEFFKVFDTPQTCTVQNDYLMRQVKSLIFDYYKGKF